MNRTAILTRTRDRQSLLPRTMESVLDQTDPDWTWVVIDSSGERWVQELLEENADKLAGRALHVRLQDAPHGIRGLPLNRGIEASSSKRITLLDDDDTWETSFLQKMNALLDEPPHPVATNIKGAVCHTRCVHERIEDGKVTPEPDKDWDLNTALRNVSLANLAVVNRFCTHAFLYDRDSLTKVGMYDESLPVLEDWDFNLRFLLHHDIEVLPEVLSYYHFRVNAGGKAEENSQHESRSPHNYFESYLVNKHLRDDIAGSGLGLGQLLAAGAMQRESLHRIEKVEGKVRSMSRKVGRVDSRTKQMKDKLV